MDTVVTQEKIQEIAEKIAREYDPEKIILFGSWVWGKPNQDSDVDILVIKKSNQPRMEREREVRSMLSPVGIPLDILVYTPSELKEKIEDDRNLFLEDIIHNGKILYANDQIRGDMVRPR